MDLIINVIVVILICGEKRNILVIYFILYQSLSKKNKEHTLDLTRKKNTFVIY